MTFRKTEGYPMLNRFLQQLCGCMTVASLFLFAGTGTAGSTAIDLEADRILRAMSDYASSLKQFD
jgi:hypothetical protein